MIQHVLKIIIAQRKSNLWLWAELMLVSVFLWYAVDDLYVKTITYNAPLGFDIGHTYQVELRTVSSESPDYIPPDRQTSTAGDDLLTIVDRIRAFPGVQEVSLSEASYPYNQSNNFSHLERITPAGDTLRTDAVLRRMITPSFFRVFRYTTDDGHTPLPDNAIDHDRIAISKDVAAQLFPEGEPIGKEVIFWERPYTVGTVTPALRYDDFRAVSPVHFSQRTAAELAREIREATLQYAEVCLRVSPEADVDFPARFRAEMKTQLRLNNVYLLHVQSFADKRERYLQTSMNELRMYVSIVAFLLISIFLGVVGTFWFRTEHRRSEMALRIALGSTTGSLRYILLSEAFLLLLLAFLPAAVVSLNIGLYELVNTELMPFTAARFLIGQLITFVLMTAMIVIGIAYPARVTEKIMPAEALRAE